MTIEQFQFQVLRHRVSCHFFVFNLRQIPSDENGDDDDDENGDDGDGADDDDADGDDGDLGDGDDGDDDGAYDDEPGLLDLAELLLDEVSEFCSR